MKNLMILTFLILLVSCDKAKDQTPETVVTCNIEESNAKKVWKSDFNSVTYDLTTCGVSSNCRMCVSAFCNTFNDFDITYYVDGTVVIDYFIIPKVIRGDWRICNGKFQLYNLTNNTPNESFTEVL